MNCIFCNQDKPPSDEHIFPDVIGGVIHIYNVCSDCNRSLGSNVDSFLTENFLIRGAVHIIGSQNKKGKVDTSYIRRALSSEDGLKYRFVFDALGKFEKILHPFIYNKVFDENGKEFLEIECDPTETYKLVIAVNNYRKRNNQPPLTVSEIQNSMKPIEKSIPKMDIHFQLELDKLSLCLLKIAYEISSMELGDAYQTDPIGIEIRNNLCRAIKHDYTNEYTKCIHFINNETDPYASKPEYHIAIFRVHKEMIKISVRIFNIFQGEYIISNSTGKYQNIESKVYINDVRNRKYTIRSIDDERKHLYQEIIDSLR